MDKAEEKISEEYIPTVPDPKGLVVDYQSNLFFCSQCDAHRELEGIVECKRDHPHAVYQKNLNGHNRSKIGYTIPLNKVNSKCQHYTMTSKVVVTHQSTPQPYFLKKEYKCNDCKQPSYKFADEYREIYDKNIISPCPHCGVGMCHWNKDKSISGNMQQIVVQEDLEDSQGNEPRHIEAVLYGKDVRSIVAGGKYEITYIVRCVYDKNVAKYSLDIVSLSPLVDDTVEDPTPFELSKFKEMSMDKIINSLAPEISHRTDEKTALLLSILSGTRKGTRRQEMSTLLVGDPSTAKSVMLNACNRLDSRTQKISGRSTSKAGMVLGLDNMSDGTRAISFGPVVMAHNSFICIDELDKMDVADQSALHDVMEDGMAKYSKIGANISMPCQVRILGAANPVGSKWSTTKNIEQNINMPNSFITRFGYVFCVLDTFDGDREMEKLCDSSYIDENGMDKFIEYKGFLTEDELRKYIKVSKSLDPQWAKGVSHTIDLKYVEMRKKVDEQRMSEDGAEGDLDIDHRTHLDLKRAAYAFARLYHSPTIEQEHANMAVDLFVKSLKSFGMNSVAEFNRKQLPTKTLSSVLNETLD
jgi:DNA replicative helicase MCM subunit Mcm2 (Cdc46/Mcm family)